MTYANKTALVVGASGAFGSAIAERLAAEGANVLATASTNESAARIPAAASMRLLLDLERAESIAALADYLVAAHKIDLIVVASGRVGFGAAESTDPTAAARLMQINHLGIANLLARLKPAMNRDSQIAVITGVVAERAFPNMSAYCASKSAMASWIESVRSEWRRDGITFVDARPGHTETGLAARPLFGSAPAMPTGMTATQVVDRIFAGLTEREAVIASESF